MKALIIKSNRSNNDLIENGGNVCNHRNEDFIKQYFGKDNVFVYELYLSKFALFSFIQCFNGYLVGGNALDVKKIKRIIKEKSIDVVYFSNSLMGKIAEKLKDVYIITFAHNVELRYFALKYSNTKRIQKIISNFVLAGVRKCESKAVHNSDMLLTLTKRDLSLFRRIYNYKKSYIIPMSIPDKIDENIKDSKCNYSNYMLFVGSDFFGNTEGLFWFINTVLPYVSYKLIVIGYGMEKYKDIYKNKNVEFIGYVTDLSTYYINAAFVVLPIKSGSGMKTKTAESLMYGKSIIGTQEAFCGYEIEVNKTGAVCNTSEEFIVSINSFQKRNQPLLNNYSRSIYKEKYSNEVVYKVFETVLGDNLKK